MPNPENIIPHKWKKGAPTPNEAGRGKGTLNSKTIIRKWLEAAEKAKNPISGQEETLSQLDIITLKQLEKARKGDTMAFRELLDRMEGKAKQAVELTGEDGGPMQMAILPTLKTIANRLNSNATPATE